jgi:hypothetical protein
MCPNQPADQRARGVPAGFAKETSMSQETLRHVQQAATADPAADQTPTLTHYDQLAAQLSASVGGLIAQIPRFESTHATTAGFVKTNKQFPADFIATVLAAVEANPELQRLEKFDVTEARDTLQFIEAFRPLVDQVDALARDLKFTIDARKAKVAADGLQIYAIAKGIARDPSSAVVAAHVRNMKRDLGRSRPKARTVTPATPPPRSPATPPPTGGSSPKP